MTAQKNNLKEVASVFLKLGIIGFGGPAAHIAMMQDEIVKKRQWITEDHFLDLISATNLIPGPNSTEMAMHCGHERAGWKGLVVAGLCFVVPAVLITAGFAWAYKQYGDLPQVAPFIYGIKPAIIAIVLSVMIALGRKALKTTTLWIIGIICAIAALSGVNEMIVLFGAGAMGILFHSFSTKRHTLKNALPLAATSPSALKIFWIFLKVGSLLYGSGYVLFGFLDGELVKTGLLTTKQLTDAIAVGQFTPGPVFSSATFIGWQMAGWPGAIAATVGIFLPSFLFVALLNPLIPRLRRSGIMSAFLDTVNVASVAIILAVCVEMGKDSIHDWKAIVIAVISLSATLLFRNLNTAFIVLGGAILGYLFYLV